MCCKLQYINLYGYVESYNVVLVKHYFENIDKIIEFWTNNQECIKGIMIESFINEGKQSINDKPLKYGISITDGCINLETTHNILEKMNNILEKSIL